ncbi:MAG: hypothetical protein IJH78_05250 [Clostridia bacterium]|nr:hypothetical protein [Clostridia bacterium]
MSAPLEEARSLLKLWGTWERRVRQYRREIEFAGRAFHGNSEADREAYAERLARLEEDIRETLRQRDRMDELIRALPPLEREVEHFRSREGMNYVAMGFRLGYSADYLRHVKQRADRLIAEALEVEAVNRDPSPAV